MRYERASLSRGLAVGILGGLVVVAATTASAQDYPSRPIRVVVPFSPGGAVDGPMRIVAQELSKRLDQQVIVENKPGAGATLGTEIVARATPDGYTLMLGYVATHGTSPAVRKLPYDAVKDFTPIAMVAGTPNILVVPASVPASGLREFVAWAKSQPGKLSYGSAGAGSLTHLAMEQFKLAADLPDITHIAYRGIGPAFTDILGGQTQAIFPGLAAGLPHIRAGKVKPLAITGLKRHPLLPEVPTFEELGFKGFDGVQWYGIVGPAQLPAGIVRRLNEEINKLLENPELRERLSGEALEPMPMSPEQFGQYMRNDITKWTRLAKERNIELTE